MSYEDWFEIVKLPAPAAGASVVRNTPGETWDSVRLANVQFTTSAVVANRQIFLDYRDGDGLTFARFEFAFNQAASQTLTYTWADQFGSGNTPAGADGVMGLTSVLMPPGTSVAIGAKNIDVGDQFGAAHLYVCRYPSGEWADSPGATPFRPAGIVIEG